MVFTHGPTETVFGESVKLVVGEYQYQNIAYEKALAGGGLLHYLNFLATHLELMSCYRDLAGKEIESWISYFPWSVLDGEKGSATDDSRQC